MDKQFTGFPHLSGSLYIEGFPAASEQDFGSFDAGLVQQAFGFPEVERFQDSNLEFQVPNSNLEQFETFFDPQDPRFGLDPHQVNQEYIHSGSPFSNPTTERLVVSASNEEPRPYVQVQDTTEAVKRRKSKGIPCPYQNHGCQSKAMLKTPKELKKHMQTHGIGEMYQCLNELGDELCGHTTHTTKRIEEHTSNHGPFGTRQYRPLSKFYPTTLRCEGCHMLFKPDGGTIEVPDEYLGTIQIGCVARICTSESVLVDWFKHVLECEAPGALSDEDLPGEKSLLFAWSEYFNVTFKQPGSEKVYMTFSANRGRNKRETQHYSQLMYARIISHTMLNEVPEDVYQFERLQAREEIAKQFPAGAELARLFPARAEMAKPLSELKSITRDNIVGPAIGGKAAETFIPLSTYLTKMLPPSLLHDYIDSARLEAIQRGVAEASSPASTESSMAMGYLSHVSTPVSTPSMIADNGSDASTPPDLSAGYSPMSMSSLDENFKPYVEGDEDAHMDDAPGFESD